jgi:hypothetical protein
VTTATADDPLSGEAVNYKKIVVQMVMTQWTEDDRIIFIYKRLWIVQNCLDLLLY